MSWRIRQAGYADLEGAALAKALSWGESLRDLVPEDALLGQRDPERLRRTVAHWGEVLDGGGYVWVVVGDDGEIVGVAQAGFARDVDAPTPLELAVLYLRRHVQGSGVADALLRTAIGDAPAYLWVLSGNARAQAFYRRHGFAPDGAFTPLAGLGLAKERWVRRETDPTDPV